MMTTEKMIEKALGQERMRVPDVNESPYEWMQFFAANGVEVQVYTNSIVDYELKKVTGYEVKRSIFWWGSQRISRKVAEELLSK